MELIESSPVFKEIKYYKSNIFNDERGRFQKPFFGELIEQKFNNSYEVIVSNSKKNVIRGLHFQKPPNDVDKLIFCLAGKIKDVFVDLRKSSKTFGMHDSRLLNEDEPVSIYIPEGFAHGFSVLSENATVLYLQSKPFNQESDTGIHYKSLDIDWEVEESIVSEKDKNLVYLKNYISPWK